MHKISMYPSCTRIDMLIAANDHRPIDRPKAPAQHFPVPASRQANCMLENLTEQSGHPESSQGPSDFCTVYSQMLYQLSYSRNDMATAVHFYGRHPLSAGSSVLAQLTERCSTKVKRLLLWLDSLCHMLGLTVPLADKDKAAKW